MKPYDELTRLGRLRRLRPLAHVALEACGLAEARLQLVRDAGNTLYRVHAARPVPGEEPDELYHPGQYLLRLHQPGYQETGAVELELAWLAALCRDAHLPVPRPVPALDGRLLIQATVPGIPGERNVSLLRWLKGRFLHTGVGPRHYRAQGRLMARLHDHAAHWQPPAGLTKRHWDWNGLFRDVEGADLPGDKVWALLPQRYEAPFEEVARQARQLFDAWGKGPDVYGLIHADLGVDANCLFWAGEARAIDFDDSGFGYWMYDLAVSLEHVREDASYPVFRDALLEGYAELRSLPDEQLRQLEFFLASFYVYLGLWAVAMIHLYPRHREELTERLERAAGHVKQYLAGD